MKTGFMAPLHEIHKAENIRDQYLKEKYHGKK